MWQCKTCSNGRCNSVTTNTQLSLPTSLLAYSVLAFLAFTRFLMRMGRKWAFYFVYLYINPWQPHIKGTIRLTGESFAAWDGILSEADVILFSLLVLAIHIHWNIPYNMESSTSLNQDSRLTKNVWTINIPPNEVTTVRCGWQFAEHHKLIWSECGLLY